MNRRTIIVLFAVSLALAVRPHLVHAQVPALTFTGGWQGVLTAGGTELRLAVDISRSVDGVYLGTLGLADQPRRIRIERIEVTGASVRLEVTAVRPHSLVSSRTSALRFGARGWRAE